MASDRSGDSMRQETEVHLAASAGVSHWVDVRDKPAFLRRLMAELSGDARLAIEGDLSQCRFPDAVVVDQNEAGILRRSTLLPELDFVIVRLTAETAGPVFDRVLSAGLKRAIVHIQIERRGILELSRTAEEIVELRLARSRDRKGVGGPIADACGSFQCPANGTRKLADSSLGST